MYLNRRTGFAHLLAPACGFAAALLLGLCVESAAPVEEQTEPGPATKEQIASEVIFSHDRHTDRGFDCGLCHGESDPAESGAEFRTMGMCFQCHEGRRGVEDCSVCHKRAHILRPADHAFDWFNIHGEQARLGENKCSMCHNRDYCQECHEGGRLLSAGSEEVTSFTPYGPQLAAKQLLVQRAHDLDYTYTHSLDASGKESDCISCHSFESFCASCHAPEDDPEKFLPLWHREAGWTPSPPGVGTGGGAHGEMARRDMELCAACHEVGIGAEDPTCLRCHRDFSPGRGNDPSTHAPGFAGDAGEGDWHEDEGAVCYICHVRESGDDRFCGYCHEEHEEEEDH